MFGGSGRRHPIPKDLKQSILVGLKVGGLGTSLAEAQGFGRSLLVSLDPSTLNT